MTPSGAGRVHAALVTLLRRNAKSQSGERASGRENQFLRECVCVSFGGGGCGNRTRKCLADTADYKSAPLPLGVTLPSSKTDALARHRENWWARLESNQRPLRYESGALSF
jgi:hypothetical protein